MIIANLFVAFALWRLWRFSLGGTTLPGKFVAAVLFLLVISGGLIDFFPIHNTGWSEVQYRNDPLIDWLKKNTTPRDIFLTDRFVNSSYPDGRTPRILWMALLFLGSWLRCE